MSEYNERDIEELKQRRLKDSFLSEADRRYAIKIVEKLVFGAVAIILVAALGALVSLIISSKAAPERPVSPTGMVQEAYI